MTKGASAALGLAMRFAATAPFLKHVIVFSFSNGINRTNSLIVNRHCLWAWQQGSGSHEGVGHNEAEAEIGA